MAAVDEHAQLSAAGIFAVVRHRDGIGRRRYVEVDVLSSLLAGASQPEG